jgi:transposase
MRKESVMSKVSKFVGLDVHKESIAVAIARGDSAAESLGTIPNDPDAVVKLVHRLGADDGLWCYEAGPCGYELRRRLSELGVNCIVVAPSLIPTKPGDRVKTDRRDALKLARLLRSGDLTAVWVPDAAHEAFRDLTRARQAAQEDVTRVRHRLTKLLLRLGVRAPATAWSKAYRQWLEALTLPQPLQQVVLEETRLAVAQGEQRVERLTAAITEAALQVSQAASIAAWQSLRGIRLTTAAMLGAEIGDVTRFRSPRELMAYTGVVPSEHSSGGSTRRGRITKTGNAHLRFALVEAAWHYRHGPRLSKALKARQQGQPAEVLAIAERAQRRLNSRYRHLVARKTKQQAVVAVARELLGFIWAIAWAVHPDQHLRPAQRQAA